MLGRKSLLMFGNNWVNHFFSIISHICIARYMGPTVLGTISYVLGLINIFTMFSDLGFNQTHLKRVSEGEDVGRCVGTFTALTLTIYTVIFVSIFLYLRFVGNVFDNVEQKKVFLILLSYQFLISLSQILLRTFNARMEMAKLSVCQTLGKLGKLLFVLVTVVMSLSIVYVSMAYLCEAIITLVAALILFRGYGFKLPTTQSFKSYLRYAAPLIVLNPLSVLTDRLDTVIIKIFWGVTEVGYYTVARSILEILKKVPSSTMDVFFPKISEDNAKKDIDAIRRRLFNVEKHLLFFITPILVIVSFYAREILQLLYGSEYYSASKIVSVLPVLAFIITTVRPYSNIIYAIEKHYLFVKISVITYIVYIICMLILMPNELLGIPMMGLKAFGAGLALFILWLIPTPFIIIWVKKYTGIGFYWNIGKYLLSGFVMFLFLELLSWIVPFEHGLTRLALGGLSGGIVYGLLLMVIRGITADDLRYYLQLCNPINMSRYVISEITKI